MSSGEQYTWLMIGPCSVFDKGQVNSGLHKVAPSYTFYMNRFTVGACFVYNYSEWEQYYILDTHCNQCMINECTKEEHHPIKIVL